MNVINKGRVMGRRLSTHCDFLWRAIMSLVIKNDWVGSGQSCILWTNRIAERWDWIVVGCNPRSAKWDTYRPKLPLFTGKIKSCCRILLWKLQKFVLTFLYWIRVVGWTEDRMSEIIMACSRWAAGVQGLMSGRGSSQKRKGDGWSPATEIIYQQEYFSCLQHAWKKIWYYTAWQS